MTSKLNKFYNSQLELTRKINFHNKKNLSSDDDDDAEIHFEDEEINIVNHRSIHIRPNRDIKLSKNNFMQEKNETYTPMDNYNLLTKNIKQDVKYNANQKMKSEYQHKEGLMIHNKAKSTYTQ